ncbi:ribosome silencing factor [bacterium]
MNTDRQIREAAKKIARYLDDRKAQVIKILDVRKISGVTDYFILATGTSTTHVVRCAEQTKKHFKKDNISPLHKEGLQKESRWVVLDYGPIIVHMLTEDVRNWYELDTYWEGAKKVSWKKKVD